MGENRFDLIPTETMNELSRIFDSYNFSTEKEHLNRAFNFLFDSKNGIDFYDKTQQDPILLLMKELCLVLDKPTNIESIEKTEDLGKKFDSGKPPLGKIPVVCWVSLAEVLKFGALKY